MSTIVPLHTKLVVEHDMTATEVNINEIAEQIHATQEFVNTFYSTVSERCGNAMINVGVFKGVLDQNSACDILNSMLKNNDDNEKFIVVAIAEIPVAKKKKQKKQIGNSAGAIPLDKHISLMNNVASLMHSLYNKRLSLIEAKAKNNIELSDREREEVAKIETLIEKLWKLKTLDQLEEGDVHGMNIPEKKLKKLEKAYPVSLRKYQEYFNSSSEYIN